MPEAVIVDAVRTPIGRAFKGSLAQLRPDEMGAFVVDQLLERNPGVDPALIEDVYCGCGMPQGLQAFNIGRIVSLLSEQLPVGTTGVTISRYCASSLESIRAAAQLGHGRPGRRLHRRRGGVGLPLQRAHRGRRRGRPERAPPGQERRPGRLHLDGPDGRERGRQVRGQPRRHGQVRAALAGARRGVAGGGLLRPRDRAGRRCPTAPRSPRTTAREPARRSRSSRSSSPPSARTARSRPATPAR